MLTKSDLSAISKVIDTKLDQKLKPINEFVKFAKPAITALKEFTKFAKPALVSLLGESQDNFERHIPERVKKLEDIHPQLHPHLS